ncbi:hypothetical protein [Halalkalicoccus salilacus]|uniref:hypothetical protein n=1 Tax=Halalkalicoccus sp. GCM10025704 TaxID=3252662 RepID=UPI00360DD761
MPSNEAIESELRAAEDGAREQPDGTEDDGTVNRAISPETISYIMYRRQFIGRTAAAGTGIGLAGCTADDGIEDVEAADTNTQNGNDTDSRSDEPEPKGGDGRPYTHYELDVHDERSMGHPVWVDRDGRVYGRSSPRVLVSDDWWETTEVLYSFEEKGTTDEYVQMVIVPDSGRIIAAIGGGARPAEKSSSSTRISAAPKPCISSITGACRTSSVTPSTETSSSSRRTACRISTRTGTPTR